MNSSQERCWWRSLPVPHTPQNSEEGCSFNGAALSELITAVHAKNADFRFRARGYSMYPVIRDGDVITLSPVRQNQLVPGDIAAYRHPLNSRLVVHRVKAFREGYCLGAGDNADIPDGWISSDAVLGIVTGVERNGRKLGWPDRTRHPFRTQLTCAVRMHMTPWSNSVRRKFIQHSQSSGFKRILRPFIRILMCSGLSPAAHFIIDAPESNEQQKIRIDLYLRELHAVRMEFLKGCTSDGGKWWFSGSGTHTLFQNLDLEREVFRKARMILSQSGESYLWVDLPAKNPGSCGFCRALGFIEEKRYPLDPDCLPGAEGERVIMRYAIRKGIS